MLEGKVVVVTGGAGLLGREFVRGIAEHRGVGIIADLDEDAGTKTKKLLSKGDMSDSIDYFPLDITSSKSIQALIDGLDSRFGKIDGWVNCAYPRNEEYGKEFFDISFESFCENVSLNIGGYFLCSQQVSKYFISQGYGNIVNIASIYGLIPPRFEIYANTGMTMPVEYAVIKSSLIHLTKYMARYLRQKRIRVNTISPGGLLEKQPEQFLKKYRDFCINKGMLETGDIVGSLLFLLSDLSEFVNGQNIVVDDGFVL